MKKNICFVTGMMFLALSLLCYPATSMASEIVLEEKVVLDNEMAKIIEITRPAGTKIPMHEHPPFMVYFIDSCQMKHTFANGKQKVKDYKAGQVTFKPEGLKHAVEIMQDQHILMIEIKTWTKE